MATLDGVADIAYADCTRRALSAPGLINPGIVDLMYLAGDHRIVEIRTPERFMGKTWRDLRLHERFHWYIVAIIRPGHASKSGDSAPATLLIPPPLLNSGRRILSSFLDWPKISNQ